MSTQSNAQGLSRAALISLVGFGALLALTVVDLSANRTVRVGIRELSLPSVDKDKVTRVEIGGKFKAILDKEAGGWVVSDPEKPDAKFAADEESVTRVLDALGTLETGAFVTGRSEKHKDLEIDDESGTVLTIKASSGPSLSVVLGRYAKGGGNYLRLQGSDEVFVGKGTLAGAVRKNADQWRNKKLVALKADDINEIAVTPAGGGGYVLTKTTTKEGEGDDAPSKDVWTVQDASALPAGFKLDEAALSRVARSVANLRASDFVDEKKPAAETVLGASARTVTAKTAAGQSVTIQFGTEKDNKVYAQVEGNPQLYQVSKYSADGVTKALTEFRDLSLFDVQTNDIVAVDWAGTGLTASLKKDEQGTWTFTSNPAGAEFDPNTVGGKLAGLTRLRAARYLGAQGAVPIDLGDKLTISLTLQDGTQQVVTFGAAAPEGEAGTGKNQVFVRNGDGHVYAIAAFQKERYKKPADLFQPAAPPPGMGGPGGMPGGMGGMQGLENLPPEIRKQLEAQLKAGNFGQ